MIDELRVSKRRAWQRGLSSLGMAEPGTNANASADGTPSLSEEWWTKAADALLRRLIGYKAGDGPPQEQTARLSKGLQISFRVSESADFGARNVRSFLRADDQSTDLLYIALCDGLVARCGPLLLRQLANTQTPDEQRPSKPSAAIRSPSVASGGRRAKAGTESVRPQPTSPDDSPDLGWWQKAILKGAEASFQAEREARERIYEQYVAALPDPLQPTFTDDASVRPNPMLWEARFKRAVAISLAARGVARDAQDDDAYHFATADEVPPSLRSTRLLGELVHAAWQFQYLEAVPPSTILAEYMFGPGVTQPTLPPVRPELKDYREILVNEEEATWLGATAWAFGKQRPDILDFTRSAIIEIKPIRGAPAGVLQLWRYTHNFNCARYFDELTKGGATGEPRYVIDPQNPSPDVFQPLDLNEFLKSYFGERDRERDEKAGRQIPAKRRRVGRSDVERSIRAGRKIHVFPHTMPGLPGLLLYTVHVSDKQEDPSTPATPEAAAVGNVVLVVTAVVLVTTVLVAIALLPVAGGAAASASLAAAETAGVGQAAAGAIGATAETAVIEAFGTGFRVSEFSSLTTDVAVVLERLGEANVL